MLLLVTLRWQDLWLSIHDVNSSSTSRSYAFLLPTRHSQTLCQSQAEFVLLLPPISYTTFPYTKFSTCFSIAAPFCKCYNPKLECCIIQFKHLFCRLWYLPAADPSADKLRDPADELWGSTKRSSSAIVFTAPSGLTKCLDVYCNFWYIHDIKYQSVGSGYIERCGRCTNYLRVWFTKHTIRGCELIKEIWYMQNSNSATVFFYYCHIHPLFDPVMHCLRASCHSALLPCLLSSSPTQLVLWSAEMLRLIRTSASVVSTFWQVLVKGGRSLGISSSYHSVFWSSPQEH